ALVACKLPAGELAEALARPLVRAKRLVVCVFRVGGYFLRNRTHLTVQRLVVLRVAQQRLDPRLVRVLRRAILFEQQLAEEDAYAYVSEGAECENAMGRSDELLDLGILGLDLRDDVADRLVDQWEPDLFRTRHPQRIG